MKVTNDPAMKSLMPDLLASTAGHLRDLDDGLGGAALCCEQAATILRAVFDARLLAFLARSHADRTTLWDNGEKRAVGRLLGLVGPKGDESDAAHRRECEAAYHQLAGMIDAEFPGEDDADAIH